MSLLEAINLSKCYRLGRSHEVWGLREANVTIKEGSWLTIIGPSGSVNSTLLSM